MPLKSSLSSFQKVIFTFVLIIHLFFFSFPTYVFLNNISHFSHYIKEMILYILYELFAQHYVFEIHPY